MQYGNGFELLKMILIWETIGWEIIPVMRSTEKSALIIKLLKTISGFYCASIWMKGESSKRSKIYKRWNKSRNF